MHVLENVYFVYICCIFSLHCYVQFYENKFIVLYCIVNNFAASKGVIYQHLVDHFTLQAYLQKPISVVYQKLIAKFRLSSHDLKVESGRYQNELRRNRICSLCDLNDIEDEFHFILKCPTYITLRQKYIKRYYIIRPSAFKLTQLLGTNNVKELCYLGKFLQAAYSKRSSLL